MPMTREEHGAAREGRITSTSASLLFSGTALAWTRLAQLLDDPPPFDEAISGPRAEGVRHEATVARRFFAKHPEISRVEDPKIVYHHDPHHRYHGLIADSPDRIVDGIPLECKWATSEARFRKLARPMAAGWPPGEHRSQLLWHLYINDTPAVWLAVASADSYSELWWPVPDLLFIDILLDQFFSQYRARRIVGRQVLTSG